MNESGMFLHYPPDEPDYAITGNQLADVVTAAQPTATTQLTR
jgi:hypothetical protein